MISQNVKRYDVEVIDASLVKADLEGSSHRISKLRIYTKRKKEPD
ncbi:hypothetical protein [Terrilactibacillus tamarindi]|nr:hypothetical protein [Terrilactibacillus tamarindi]